MRPLHEVLEVRKTRFFVEIFVEGIRCKSLQTDGEKSIPSYSWSSPNADSFVADEVLFKGLKRQFNGIISLKRLFCLHLPSFPRS